MFCNTKAKHLKHWQNQLSVSWINSIYLLLSQLQLNISCTVLICVYQCWCISNILNRYQYPQYTDPQTSSAVANSNDDKSFYICVKSLSCCKFPKPKKKWENQCRMCEWSGVDKWFDSWGRSWSPIYFSQQGSTTYTYILICLLYFCLYTFHNRDLPLDLDWHLLSWTHLVQRSSYFTTMHRNVPHIFPSPPISITNTVIGLSSRSQCIVMVSLRIKWSNNLLWEKIRSVKQPIEPIFFSTAMPRWYFSTIWCKFWWVGPY